MPPKSTDLCFRTAWLWLAVLPIAAPVWSAELLPELEVIGAIKRLDYRTAEGAELGVGSRARPSLRPGLVLRSESRDPTRFTLQARFEGGQYTAGRDRIDENGGVVLYGGGVALSQDLDRWRIGLGGVYGQEKALSRDTASYLATVWQGSASVDVSVVAIGTSFKTLRLGLQGTRYFESSLTSRDSRLSSGMGGTVYWVYETGESFGLGLFSGFSLRSFSIGTGSLSVSEFFLGFKLFAPHQDLTRLPSDY